MPPRIVGVKNDSNDQQPESKEPSELRAEGPKIVSSKEFGEQQSERPKVFDSPKQPATQTILGGSSRIAEPQKPQAPSLPPARPRVLQYKAIPAKPCFIETR